MTPSRRRSGKMLLSVGDVTGHDGDAAATMAQLRNLIRGLSFDRDEGPAAVLRRLDAALDGLDLDTFATAIVVLIDPPQPTHRAVPPLRWSSAGHLPLPVRLPSGEVETHLRPADLLLGFDPKATRSEHVIDLPQEAVALLYTDGLVERRKRSLDEGLDRLAKAFASSLSVISKRCATI